MTTITALPTAPSRTDPSTFSARADALLGALDQFVTETNAVAGEVNANATIATTQVALATTQVALATTQATNAANSATASAQSALVAGAVAWVSGTTYAIGNARYSPANGQTYRRLTAGAGTTDPSADTTNWVIVNGITSEAILLTTNNLPTVRPTLNLDFANSKIVDPRITFTRASTATMVNANGLIETVASGAPRIDYDPVTLACKGLLIEEARTNLLTYSEQFDNAAWTKTNTTITANAVTAPDGTTTADSLVEASDTSQVHMIQQSQTVTSLGAYTVKACCKAGTRTKCRIMYIAGGGSVVYADADLSAGTIGAAVAGSGAAVVGSSSIQALLNGWYLIAVSGTGAAGTIGTYRIEMLDASGNRSYNGDGTSGLYIWGAQLEAGAFATSYIPTTSAQVTRAADIATMTGGNFSRWYRQDEGTFVVGFDAYSTTATGYNGVFDANSGSNADSLSLVSNNGAGTFVSNIAVASVTQVFAATSAIANNTRTLFSLAYKLNDFAQSLNGASVSTDTSCTIPTVTTLLLGKFSGGGYSSGHIARISYYPKRLANATLQALSTP